MLIAADHYRADEARLTVHQERKERLLGQSQFAMPVGYVGIHRLTRCQNCATLLDSQARH